MPSIDTEHSTATDRAWDALADTLDSLPSEALARIARGEEQMPKRAGIRVLIARNRLDMKDICLMTLAHRGEDANGRFVGWEVAGNAYLAQSSLVAGEPDAEWDEAVRLIADKRVQ